MSLRHAGRYLISLILLVSVLLCSCRREGTGNDSSADGASLKGDALSTETAGGLSDMREDGESLYYCTNWELAMQEGKICSAYAFGEKYVYYAVSSLGLDLDTRLYKVSYEEIRKMEESLYLIAGVALEGGQRLGDAAEEILRTPESGYIFGMSFCDGRLYCSCNCSKGEEALWRIDVYDEEGGLLEELDITETYEQFENETDKVFGEAVVTKLDILSTAEGNYYYISGASGSGTVLYVLDGKGRTVRSEVLDFAAEDLEAYGKNMYISYADKERGAALAVYDPMSGLADAEYFEGVKTVFGIVQGMDTQSEEEGILLYNSGGIRNAVMEKDGAGRRFVNLLSYKTDINDWRWNSFDSMVETGSGSYMAGLLLKPSAGGGMLTLYLVCLRDSGIERPEERQVLTLAGNGGDEFRETVDLFNRNSMLYQVEIVDYDQARLGADLVSGKGPDLLAADKIDLKRFTEMGIVEDLYTYMALPGEKENALSADMLEPVILSAYTFDGKLGALPATFYLDTLIGRKSFVGEEQGWTTEEYLSTLEENMDINIAYPGGSPDGFLMIEQILRARREDFVDFETLTAHFDSEEFIAALKSAAAYKSVEYSGADSMEKRMAEGKLLLCNYPVYSMNSLLRCMFEAGEDSINIGYPTKAGAPAYGIDTSTGFAINANSDCKEGAWAFIEFLVMNQRNEKPALSMSFPVLKDVMENLFQSLSEVKYEYDIMGNLVLNADGTPKEKVINTFTSWDGSRGRVITHLTEEDIEQVRFMMENIVFVSSGAWLVIDEIIYEELEGMMDGRSTPEKTAESLQNRVEMYLGELE